MNDYELINRMIHCGQKIIKYMREVTCYDEFLSNDEKMDAVYLNLEQLGETAKKITETTRYLLLEIEWKKIIGLRNLISHDYDGVSHQIIYSIVMNHIPSLIAKLETFLKDHRESLIPTVSKKG